MLSPLGDIVIGEVCSEIVFDRDGVNIRHLLSIVDVAIIFVGMNVTC